MNCPRCLKGTKVVDSRMPTKDTKGDLSKIGDKAFGWWSADYRVRKRRCKSCQLAFHTVEVSTKDLNEAFQDAKQ